MNKAPHLFNSYVDNSKGVPRDGQDERKEEEEEEEGC